MLAPNSIPKVPCWVLDEARNIWSQGHTIESINWINCDRHPKGAQFTWCIKILTKDKRRVYDLFMLAPAGEDLGEEAVAVECEVV
jgi:hypothetical protein